MAKTLIFKLCNNASTGIFLLFKVEVHPSAHFLSNQQLPNANGFQIRRGTRIKQVLLLGKSPPPVNFFSKAFQSAKNALNGIC